MNKMCRFICLLLSVVCLCSINTLEAYATNVQGENISEENSQNENQENNATNNGETLYAIRSLDVYKYSSNVEIRSNFGSRSYSESLPAEYASVSTPNGSNVDSAIHILTDFSANEKQNMRDEISNDYPFAIYLAEATYKYNCHSYAWYMNDEDDNDVWINEPDIYWEDESYEEVSNPRAGDIICYYNRWGVLLHSGIVFGVSGNIPANTDNKEQYVDVISKWGPYGLYQHNGLECPYAEGCVGYEDMDEAARNALVAATVVFYRPRTDDSVNIGDSVTNSYFDDTKYVSPSNTDKSLTYSMYELNIEDSGYYNIVIGSINAWDIDVFDEYMHLQNISFSNESGYTYTYFGYLYSDRYYLRSDFVDSSNSGDITVIIAYHDEHSGCVALNATYHVIDCECGYYVQEEHIWVSSGLLDYFECRECGYQKRTGGGIFIPIIKNELEEEEETE